MNHARLTIDPHFSVGPINRRLFGSFAEHLGRCVYDGIYEPGHPAADEHGYREDVIALVRELGVTAVRYPGGNFVSGYRWEDGIGPREQRPRRLDLAWHSTETNAVGLDEFAAWLRKVGGELMYAVDLGTRGVHEALDVLEYANIPSGTFLSDLRIANGTVAPHDIRMWCLGNEMDGPWQLGHASADEYASLAAKTARAMRQVDPDLELVVCGSSGAQMPTFGSWERTVLEATYDEVDDISCHAYYEPKDGHHASFLASAVDMDRYIESVAATADHVKAARHSEKTMHISVDEWNVWYQSLHGAEQRTAIDDWPVAPRLLENTYSVMDAVATHDSGSGTTAVFLVNRGEATETQVEIDVGTLGDVGVRDVWTLSDNDPHASNTLEQQDRVRPVTNPTVALSDGTATVSLPPVSWTALTLG